MNNLNKRITFCLLLFATLFCSTNMMAQCEGSTCPATGPAGGFIFTLDGTVCAYDGNGDCRAFILPLPVELTYFRTTAVGQTIELKWETASEENNDYFEILKSTDGQTFVPIAHVDGRGTTSEAQLYSYVDLNPTSGENYYMLRQVDFDGTDANSDIANVNYRTDKVFKTVKKAVYGNEIQLSYNTIEHGNYELTVIDISGKVISHQSIFLNEGLNEINLDIQNSGVFMVMLSNGEKRLTDKIFK